MTSQPHSLLRYALKSLSRGMIRRAIAPLVRWEPAHDPAHGVTVIVGCSHRLESLIPANLALLARQQAPSLREVLLVIDAGAAEMSAGFHERVRRAAGGLQVRCLHYDERQLRVSRRIDWGWVYAWLSWCIGIGASRTRYAMLHDFDALLLDPGVIEERFRLIEDRQAVYLGMGYYEGLGIRPDDGLVKTFELAFDAAFVRENFEPIELFNTMARFRGRRVEFDTFLNAQSRAGRIDMVPIDETRMVHPSQMICQFVDHRRRPHRVPGRNNLLLVPYYERVGGDAGPLEAMTGRLRATTDGSVLAWGRQLDVKALGGEHAQWLRKQAYRVETVLRGGPDPEVVAYFDALEAVATGERGR